MKVVIKHIYRSVDHNYFGRYGKGSLDYTVEECSSVQLEAGKGIEGDRFFDYKPDYKGQITFFDWSVFELVRDQLMNGELEPSKFRRNVMIEGVNLNTLIGKKFSIGELEFTGSCECSPCFWMDEACVEGTEQFLKGRGGLRARITGGGGLSVGEYELKVLGNIGADE